MRYHFHVVYNQALVYDKDGQQFAAFDSARFYALRAIQHFFLSHPIPRHRLMLKRMLCITREDGDIVEVVPFLEAFDAEDPVSVIHCGPSHA